MPVPWLFFGGPNYDGTGNGWKDFGEFFSGFLFSSSWAIIGIAYHQGSTNGLSLGLGLLGNTFVMLGVSLYFYWDAKEAFNNGSGF